MSKFFKKMLFSVIAEFGGAMKMGMLVLVVCLLSVVSALAATELTDSQAKDLIETFMISTSEYSIRLGPLTIVGGMMGMGASPNPQQGSISADQYKTYKAFERLGLISIEEDRGFRDHKSGKKFSWGDYNQQFSGVIDKIVVRDTSKGKDIAQQGGLPQKNGWLTIKQGMFYVEGIVRNEALRRGTYDYRLTMATYVARWTPEYKQAVEMSGRRILDERKAMLLFKYDPFDSKWVIVASDYANRSEEFTTDNVSRAISKLPQ